MAKLFCSETALGVIDKAVQIHGGYGHAGVPGGASLSRFEADHHRRRHIPDHEAHHHPGDRPAGRSINRYKGVKKCPTSLAFILKSSPVGREFKTVGRTMTETDIVNFCGFSGDFNPLHTDAEYAAKQPFGGRIAHGMCGFSMATGLLVRLNILEGTILAFFGIENWRFKAPVMIGDTIHGVARVAEAKATKKADRGIVALDFDIINQKGQSVMGGRLLVMMRRKPA